MLSLLGEHVMAERLIVTWHGLKQMGWPYSRTQTWRMMEPTITRSKGGKRNGTYRQWVEPNPDPFPLCHKLNNYRHSHPVWIVREVIAYFERHGLDITADWQRSL
jgi:hypothetical protein